MAHATIKQILKIYQAGGVWITEIEDSDGNVLTGVGNEWRTGDRIITFFDDRYQRPKFLPDNSACL